MNAEHNRKTKRKQWKHSGHAGGTQGRIIIVQSNRHATGSQWDTRRIMIDTRSRVKHHGWLVRCHV
eukprot:8165759-Pyramimonas_sp.AAC.1